MLIVIGTIFMVWWRGNENGSGIGQFKTAIATAVVALAR